jgi:hypothetical protein
MSDKSEAPESPEAHIVFSIMQRAAAARAAATRTPSVQELLDGAREAEARFRTAERAVKAASAVVERRRATVARIERRAEEEAATVAQRNADVEAARAKVTAAAHAAADGRGDSTAVDRAVEQEQAADRAKKAAMAIERAQRAALLPACGELKESEGAEEKARESAAMAEITHLRCQTAEVVLRMEALLQDAIAPAVTAYEEAVQKASALYGGTKLARIVPMDSGAAALVADTLLRACEETELVDVLVERLTRRNARRRPSGIGE